MTQREHRLFPKADRYLLAITLIWGSTFTVTKFTLNDLPPLLLQGTRFLAAAVMVGIYTWRDIKTTPPPSLRFDREIVFWQFVATSIIGFGLSPFLDATAPRFSTEAIGAVLYLAFFASTIAIFVQSKYQRETTPTKAAIIFTMEPVFAAIIAYLALSEAMGGIEVLGAAIMFSGLLFSEIYAARAHR